MEVITYFTLTSPIHLFPPFVFQSEEHSHFLKLQNRLVYAFPAGRIWKTDISHKITEDNLNVNIFNIDVVIEN